MRQENKRTVDWQRHVIKEREGEGDKKKDRKKEENRTRQSVNVTKVKTSGKETMTANEAREERQEGESRE